MPADGTPTSAAVEGALIAAETYVTAQPLTKMGVVFVTDGEPNGCNENVAELATTVGGALSRSGIRTYAIGISDTRLAFLDELASAGGTGEAHLALQVTRWPASNPTASAVTACATSARERLETPCEQHRKLGGHA